MNESEEPPLAARGGDRSVRARRPRPRIFVLGATIVLAVCDAASGTLGPADLQISAGPDPLTVRAGSPTEASVTILRGAAYHGPVTLAATGVPDGVDVTPWVASAVEDRGHVTFSTDCATVGASAPVTITATADGLDGRATSDIVLVVEEREGGCFSIVVGDDDLTLDPGVPDTTDVLLRRWPGFDEAIGLAAEGVPAGVTATFLDDPAEHDTVRMVVGADASARTFYRLPFAVTASAAAASPKTDSVTVLVAPTGTFGLSITPDTIVVVPGGTGSATVTLDRSSGFEAAVAVTLEGLPEGFIVTLGDVPITEADTVTVEGERASFAFAADTSVQADTTWSVVARGASEGAPDATDTLFVRVPAPEGAPRKGVSARRDSGG